MNYKIKKITGPKWWNQYNLWE